MRPDLLTAKELILGLAGIRQPAPKALKTQPYPPEVRRLLNEPLSNQSLKQAKHPCFRAANEGFQVAPVFCPHHASNKLGAKHGDREKKVPVFIGSRNRPPGRKAAAMPQRTLPCFLIPGEHASPPDVPSR
jgi:hypothetical protein